MPKIEKRRAKNATKNIALVSLFVALIIVGGFIKIPLGVVPITLQLAMVLLSGSIGGKKIGVMAVSIYIVMGLIGLPIFSTGGGIFYFLKPTFGYLIGFIFASLIAGIECKTLWTKLISLLLAVLIAHVVGVAYLYLTLNYYLSTPITVETAIISGSLMFLPTDVLFSFVVAFISYKLKKHLHV